jgi:hypothetical protein
VEVHGKTNLQILSEGILMSDYRQEHVQAQDAPHDIRRYFIAVAKERAVYVA